MNDFIQRKMILLKEKHIKCICLHQVLLIYMVFPVHISFHICVYIFVCVFRVVLGINVDYYQLLISAYQFISICILILHKHYGTYIKYIIFNNFRMWLEQNLSSDSTNRCQLKQGDVHSWKRWDSIWKSILSGVHTM